MRVEDATDVSEYAAALSETLGRWSPGQRTAFAAALAERWLPVYAASSQSAAPEDRALLREAVDAAWADARAGGDPAAAGNLARLRQSVAERAIREDAAGNARAANAVRIIEYALECCGGAPNAVEAARWAALTAYETSVGPAWDAPPDVDLKKVAWDQPAVRAEVGQQQTMVALVGSFPILDDTSVEWLKRNCIPALQQTPEQPRRLSTTTLTLEGITPGVQQLSAVFARVASAFGMFGGKGQKQDPSGLPGGTLADVTRKFEQLQQEHALEREREHPQELEHERDLDAALRAFSPSQRLAFVASLAERWLPEYEAYAAVAGEGDARQMRQIMDAVWDHLRGRPIPARDRARYSKQVIANLPEDPDPPVLVACMVLDYALDCCGSEDSNLTAKSAALECCEARLSEETRSWDEEEVQDEIAKQDALLERIRSISRFDDGTVESLRAPAKS